MELLRNLFKWLFHPGPQPITTPGILVFNEIDANEIQRKLNLLVVAKENGEENLPPTDADLQDSHELEVISEVMNVVRPILQTYDVHQQAYAARLSGLHPMGIANEYRGRMDQLTLNLKFKIDQTTARLYLVKESLRDIERDWLEFKVKWGVTSDPDKYLKASTRWFFLGLLILAETVVNGLLIAPYASGGTFEGLAIAFMFPVITLVACAFPFAYGLRIYKRPGHWLKQSGTLFAGSLFLIPALLMSLLLAYIRQQLELEAEWETGMDVWLATLTGNFQPLGLTSFLLFLFSSLLFFFAVYDIYKMDHPVPGLMDKFRQRNHKHQSYRRELQGVHSEFLDLNEAATQQSTSIYEHLRNSQREQNKILEQQRTQWQRLQAYIHHAEDVVNRLIKRYREENLKSRASPPPAYFNKTWTFPLVEYKAMINLQSAEGYGDILLKAQEEIRVTQSALSEEFSKIPEIIKNIDAILIR